MQRVLMTSFEPFGGHTLNSSLEVARVLSGQTIPDVELEWRQLPVVAPDCVQHAWQFIEGKRWSLVLALGQSARASVVRLEDRAINFDDFPIPDNAGNQPKKRWIMPGAPVRYRTTARLDALLGGLRQRGIAHEHSLSAGTYVCNHLYFGLLHRAEQTALSHQTLFVHLPLLPAQIPAGQKGPCQPLASLVEAVREVICLCVAEVGSSA